MANIDHQSSKQLQALVALELSRKQPHGERPDLMEIDAWRLGNLEGQRAAEVLSYIANDPDCYAQWLELIEIQEELDDAQFVEEPLSKREKSSQEAWWSRLLGLLSFQPSPVFSGMALATIAVLILGPLMFFRSTSYTQMMDESYQLYGGFDSAQTIALEVKPAITKGLDDLLAGTVIPDFDRHHIRLGFSQFINRVNWSQYSVWRDLSKKLPNQAMSCQEVSGIEDCDQSATKLTALGEWSLMNYVACKNGGSGVPPGFWANQSKVIDSMAKSEGTFGKFTDSVNTSKSQLAGKSAICKFSETIVQQNM